MESEPGENLLKGMEASAEVLPRLVDEYWMLRGRQPWNDVLMVCCDVL